MDSNNTGSKNLNNNPPRLLKKGPEILDLSSDSELSSLPSSDELDDEMNSKKKPVEKVVKA